MVPRTWVCVCVCVYVCVCVGGFGFRVSGFGFREWRRHKFWKVLSIVPLYRH